MKHSHPQTNRCKSAWIKQHSQDISCKTFTHPVWLYVFLQYKLIEQKQFTLEIYIFVRVLVVSTQY